MWIVTFPQAGIGPTLNLILDTPRSKNCSDSPSGLGCRGVLDICEYARFFNLVFVSWLPAQRFSRNFPKFCRMKPTEHDRIWPSAPVPTSLSARSHMCERCRKNARPRVSPLACVLAKAAKFLAYARAWVCFVCPCLMSSVNWRRWSRNSKALPVDARRSLDRKKGITVEPRSEAPAYEAIPA